MVPLPYSPSTMKTSGFFFSFIIGMYVAFLRHERMMDIKLSGKLKKCRTFSMKSQEIVSKAFAISNLKTIQPFIFVLSDAWSAKSLEL